MTGLVDRVDAYQRRHPAVGFPLAVIYKYFDDQGPYLAAIVTYYAFVAIFPILLLATSVLGFLLQGDPEMEQELLDSTLSQVPIIGTQLGRPEGLQGSTAAVVIGGLAALYGLLGLGQAAQHALNTAWAVPMNTRFNPFVGRARGLLSMIGAGLVVLTVSALSTFAINLDALGLPTPFGWLGRLGVLVLTAVVLSVMMRFTTAERPSFRTNLPGGIVIAVCWFVLQLAGGLYVEKVISAANEMNSVFALVLGLIGLLFLAAALAVIGVEVSVVLHKRLYPRALLAPFTDAVDLTEADRRAYDSYAKATRHKGFQRVNVSFDKDDGGRRG